MNDTTETILMIAGIIVSLIGTLKLTYKFSNSCCTCEVQNDNTVIVTPRSLFKRILEKMKNDNNEVTETNNEVTETNNNNLETNNNINNIPV